MFQTAQESIVRSLFWFWIIPPWTRLSTDLFPRSSSHVWEHSRGNQVLCAREVGAICRWSLPRECVRRWCPVPLVQESTAGPGSWVQRLPTYLTSFQCQRIHWRVRYVKWQTSNNLLRGRVGGGGGQTVDKFYALPPSPPPFVSPGHLQTKS